VSKEQESIDLVHCIYCSASTSANFDQSGLESLLEECRRKNGEAGISGILLYRDGSFFQVLEGERGVVQALYNKISMDKRHSKTTKIVFEPIPERAFAAWTMGFPRIRDTEFGEIPGLNDFFAQGKSFFELGEGRAKTLLAAFKEGMWRSKI